MGVYSMNKYLLAVCVIFSNNVLQGFHYLYAPWRTEYILHTGHKPVVSYAQEDCVFCKRMAAHDDSIHFILHRFEHHIVILNKYPYNTGHLLIVPYEHVPDLHDLSQEARDELMELITESVQILKKVLDAHAVNVGINLGKAAGAGIPAHLHIHLVPRWEGDTGFLDTCAETKLVPVDLQQVFEQLKPYFQALEAR